MPTLSEALTEHAQDKPIQSWTKPQTEQDKWDDRAQDLMREAARLLAPFEQPEVAELLKRAGQRERAPQAYRTNGAVLESAKDLRAHARALGELAEEREKVAAVEAAVIGLRNDAIEFTMTVGDSKSGGALFCAADKIDAALAGAGGEREKPDVDASGR